MAAGQKKYRLTVGTIRRQREDNYPEGALQNDVFNDNVFQQQCEQEAKHGVKSLEMN